VFLHSLYEYKKGLRNLVFYTGNIEEKNVIVRKLKSKGISCYAQKVNGAKMNIFFGDDACVKIVRQMRFESLSNLTGEEDFILGIMLGYDRLEQCKRYLRRKQG
jgi:hypothetical protein